jgi:hypothetical protein
MDAGRVGDDGGGTSRSDARGWRGSAVGTSGLTATVPYGRGVDPLTVAAWRMGLGAVALVAALGLRSRRHADIRFVALRLLDGPQR